MVIDAAALFRSSPADRVLLALIVARLAELERAKLKPTHVLVHSGRFGGVAGSRLLGLEVIFSYLVAPDAAYLMVRA
jgi:hypothetical protein